MQVLRERNQVLEEDVKEVLLTGTRPMAWSSKACTAPALSELLHIDLLNDAEAHLAQGQSHLIRAVDLPPISGCQTL